MGTLCCVFKFPKGVEGGKTEIRTQRVGSILKEPDDRDVVSSFGGHCSCSEEGGEQRLTLQQEHGW